MPASNDRTATPTRRARARGGRERAAHLGPERRRPLVLDAALRLFVKSGYRGTSMEAIAKAAGVTKPVVYECYPGKAELFRALLEREERRLMEAVAAALPRDVDADDVEALATGGFVALLRAAAEAPDSWRVVFGSDHGGDREIRRRFRRGRRAAVVQLASLAREVLIARGAGDVERLAPATGELLASLGEGGVRLLLDPASQWEPDELGALLGKLAAEGVDRIARDATGLARATPASPGRS
jgi:AcrR family transcriptional regulator